MAEVSCTRERRAERGMSNGQGSDHKGLCKNQRKRWEFILSGGLRESAL